MIALLSGCVTHKFDDHVILDVNGVGYEIFLPSLKIVKIPSNIPLKLFIHTHVREDSFDLFGFETLEEKQLFKILIGISGVGPRLALTILNTMDVSALVNAIIMGNSTLLTRIPGIGNKTAERIVLELKNNSSIKTFTSGKQVSTDTTLKPSIKRTKSSDQKMRPGEKTSEEASHFDDAINALISLGYRDGEAMNAVRTVISNDPSNLQHIIKMALKELS